MAGLVGIVLCAITPLLPVDKSTAKIDWPAGQPLSSATASVTAPLIAQTPQTLDATIPCSLIDSLGTDGGLVLATMPPSAQQFNQKALVVSASASSVSVIFRNELAATRPATPSDRRSAAICGSGRTLQGWVHSSSVSVRSAPWASTNDHSSTASSPTSPPTT